MAPFGPGFSIRAGLGADGLALGFEGLAARVPVAGISGGDIGAWFGVAAEP